MNQPTKPDSIEPIDVALEALKKISETRFGYDGDCGVVRYADDAIYEIETILADRAHRPAAACTCPSGDGSLRWPCPADHAAAAPVPASEAASVPEGDSFKPVYWFSVLAKCARLLDLPDDEPIPSGVLKAVEALVASPAAPTDAKPKCEFNGDGLDGGEPGYPDNAELVAKLERVSKWINKFPIPTSGATAMMCLIREVQTEIAATTGASQSVRDAAQPTIAAEEVRDAALITEALQVFDSMLQGCRVQKFGDYQNGDGEEIGPRMDALHAKLRAIASATTTPKD